MKQTYSKSGEYMAVIHSVNDETGICSAQILKKIRNYWEPVESGTNMKYSRVLEILEQ